MPLARGPGSACRWHGHGSRASACSILTGAGTSHESAWLLLFEALCIWQQAERSARKSMSANVSHKGDIVMRHLTKWSRSRRAGPVAPGASACSTCAPRGAAAPPAAQSPPAACPASTRRSGPAAPAAAAASAAAAAAAAAAARLPQVHGCRLRPHRELEDAAGWLLPPPTPQRQLGAARGWDVGRPTAARCHDAAPHPVPLPELLPPGCRAVCRVPGRQPALLRCRTRPSRTPACP